MNGNEAGEPPDESDLLRAKMDSGIAMAKAGRARLRLALPRHRDLAVSNHSLAFRSLCTAYEVAALTIEDLRKEIPRREELLEEYEKLCRDIEADAVAMLEGETSYRWR
ncbi:hypothetical protein [Ensifer aridi]|uniref:hypothetical protein n=1 Tax=Ensifer aridi TaxID=1708715 RepID=UPI000A10BA48|nr:hypothetical protein [Ensifer aridi]